MANLLHNAKSLWLIFHIITYCSFAFGSSKVRLSDVSTLTLYDGKMTTGRRSQPVKQLQCIGGSAGCDKFKPSTVQCYNRGSDGLDVQWECKAEMGNAYKFGQVQVTCEGYEYPDDPYILKGSCGLEYSIDYTGEQTGENGYSYKPLKKSSYLADILFWIIVGLLCLLVFRLFIYQSPDRRPGGVGGSGFGGSDHRGDGGPPPPGFRPDYYPDDSCYRTTQGSSTYGGASTGGGAGFWTGLGAGGLLGYLFGNRGNYYNQRPGYFNSPGASYGHYGGGGFSSGLGTSTGTRSTSGYGGTRRR